EAKGAKGKRDVDVPLFRHVAEPSPASDLRRLVDRPAPRRVEIDFVEDQDVGAGVGHLSRNLREARSHLLLRSAGPVAGAELATPGVGNVEGRDANGCRRSR